MELQIGSFLQHGKYRIDKVLGQGGFGITYQGFQVGLKRNVAIKEFFMKSYCDRDGTTSHVTVPTESNREMVTRYREKFIKEAQMIGTLDNPHIVVVHDTFEENGTAYYVMEFLDGGSLSKLVERDGPMQETQALGYIRQVAEALAYMHGMRKCHLDVKPGNILLNKKGNAVLIDFGLSKNYDEGGHQTSNTPVGISKGYAPTEQYNQDLDSFSPQTDIYALGGTLFYLLTGEVPPEASIVLNKRGVIGKELLENGTSKRTADIVSRMMMPIIADRPENIAECMALFDGESCDKGKVEDDTLIVKDDVKVVPETKKPDVDVEIHRENKKQISKTIYRKWKRYGYGVLAGVIGVIIVVAAVNHFATSGKEHVRGDTISTGVSSDGTGGFTVKGVDFKMVKVDGGTFQMGATSEQGSDAQSDESPVHSVTLSGYYIGQTEVTQALWEAVMGSNPSEYEGAQKPVERVSWIDCQDFISKLNSLTGKHFRLPTEAEWEFAARGGNMTKGYKYSGSGKIDDVAWYKGNSGSRTHDVGTKSANELGLYDMSGNVWEWCSDWYGDYDSGSQTNPRGAESGSYRVRRGGSWYIEALYCRVSYRYYFTPDYRYSYLGLRLALSVL